MKNTQSKDGQFTSGTKELLLKEDSSKIICRNCVHYLSAIVPGTFPRCNEFGHKITFFDESYAEICRLYWNKYIKPNFLEWIENE